MMVPKRILVRSPNWIGDQILAYPFFYYLRKAYPNARILSACVPWVQSAQFLNLVDDVIVLPQALAPTFWAKWDVLEKGAQMLKRNEPWDLGISLPNSFSSAWLLYRSNVRMRRGYGADGRGFLLSQRVRPHKEGLIHRSESYVRLLPEAAIPKLPATEFWGIPPVNELDPGIPGEQSEFDAERAWPGAEPFDPPQGPYWVLAPGSTAESRRWPIDKFMSLAQIIAKETGWIGIVVGGAAESSLVSRWVSDPSLKLMDWTGKGSVSSYWKVFKGARFSVCNDSGLAHVASLCGSPVQVVWGGGEPRRTEPIGPGKVQITLNPVDCWPCERNDCSQPPEKKLDCLKGISPDSVWNDIKNGFRPKP